MNTPERWPDDPDRWELCFHEAGHAVVFVALGVPIRYITLRPRSTGAAAHVVMGTSGTHPAYYRGDWEAIGAGAAAGIIAQWIITTETPRPGEDEWAARRRLTRICGRDDMKNLRRGVNRAWSRNMTLWDRIEDWSTTPVPAGASPVDLAVLAWCRAVKTLASHWDAVEELSEVLYDSRSKVTGRTVREIIAGSVVDLTAAAEVTPEWFEPWFLEHSKLSWTPPDSWFAEVERFAEMRRQHGIELAASGRAT